MTNDKFVTLQNAIKTAADQFLAGTAEADLVLSHQTAARVLADLADTLWIHDEADESDESGNYQCPEGCECSCSDVPEAVAEDASAVLASFKDLTGMDLEKATSFYAAQPSDEIWPLVEKLRASLPKATYPEMARAQLAAVSTLLGAMMLYLDKAGYGHIPQLAYFMQYGVPEGPLATPGHSLVLLQSMMDKLSVVGCPGCSDCACERPSTESKDQN